MKYENGTVPGERPEASLSRAELVEAWREQRRARRLQSAKPGADTESGPDGFALRRWRRAGVFGAEAVPRVERLLKDLLDAEPGEDAAPDWAVRTVRQCLDGDPVAQLPSAVRAVLERVGSRHTVAAMEVIHEAGLPWLTPAGQQRLDHLLGSGPGLLEQDALPTTGEDVSGAFTLQYAMRHADLATLPPTAHDRILPWAPLGTVDDLVEAGLVTRDNAPWNLRSDDHDRCYLLARLSPEQVEPLTASAIGWQQPVQRQRLLDGEDVDCEEGSAYDLLQRAAEGDTGVLKELEQHLPRPLVLRLRRVQDGALTGNWDPDVLGDRGLWRLMAALWEPKAAVSPGRGPFHALMALRHAYDVICAGDFKKARAQVAKLAAHEEGDPRHRAESLNMRAYLALLEEDTDSALIALSSIPDPHPRVEANMELVRRRRETPRNDRPHPSNPFLELGLPNGSEVWKQRYRDLRRAYVDERDEAARINRAMRRIQQAERDEDWSGFFALPLEDGVFDLPSGPPVTLVPPVDPMPRRTVPEDPADFEVIRRQAVADLLPTLLNAPRRPDHQHRTSE
ncbi:hypothetical protein ACWC3X_01835 [Streptomyces populi]|jgi:hypothetical protein